MRRFRSERDSGLIESVINFKMNSSLQVLRQLQQGLAKCYSVAFEKSGAVSDAKITPHTLNFVKKLVSTFGVGLENVSNVSTMFSSAASESLARRAQATAQDPVFQKMKGQFTTGQFLLSSCLFLMCHCCRHTPLSFIHWRSAFQEKNRKQSFQ